MQGKGLVTPVLTICSTAQMCAGQLIKLYYWKDPIQSGLVIKSWVLLIDHSTDNIVYDHTDSQEGKSAFSSELLSFIRDSKKLEMASIYMQFAILSQK